jgi:hypothetical protein
MVPSVMLALRLAQALGVTVDTLFSLDDADVMVVRDGAKRPAE